MSFLLSFYFMFRYSNENITVNPCNAGRHSTSSAIIHLIRRLSGTADWPVKSFLLYAEKHKINISLDWFLEVLLIKN